MSNAALMAAAGAAAGVVGEVRGPEALDMLGALSCGHDGSLGTVHAGSAAEALRRLETLALMAGLGLPLSLIHI